MKKKDTAVSSNSLIKVIDEMGMKWMKCELLLLLRVLVLKTMVALAIEDWQAVLVWMERTGPRKEELWSDLVMMGMMEIEKEPASVELREYHDQHFEFVKEWSDG